MFTRGRFESLGEEVDPNLHDVKFEMPDSSGEKAPGTVGAVLRQGYKLEDRVLRPAEVGSVIG